MQNWALSRLAHVCQLLVDVPHMPDGLTSLTQLRWNVNQPVAEGALPAGLIISTSLWRRTFGEGFKQPLEEGMLPVGLSQLTIRGNVRITDIPTGCSVQYTWAASDDEVESDDEVDEDG
jgi:hypothetical protein